MCCYYKKGFVLACVTFSMLMFDAASQCSRKAVMFNFGDSNSDTGGLAAAMGYEFGYPDGRAFFHRPTGRLCDGRLIIDFLCENVKSNYLSPYLESVEPDFSNGANFAIAGSATLPRYVAFSLSVQILEFRRFRNHSLQLQSKGHVVGEDDFKNGLYMIDIGQNDLTAAFNNVPYDQVLEKIPSFISEIKDAMWSIYLTGGKKLWVHNTGPLGCLPEKLGTLKPTASQVDEHGCVASMNQAAQVFNSQLRDLCQQLRGQMKDSTIVYVDVYSIKYSLIANSSSLMACCGHGGPPYNFDPKIKCRDAGCNVCEEGTGTGYVSWDGVHYTQAANTIVASAILSTKYSTPTLPFNFFCNN
ncbi:GDSL esterase/lipase LIP-4-like isoform X1 [Salvia miltiorrhiza]|uniref:GDSL esterase/lipase LIP-4-like isoform X1 n=2 Tax=Salvia miltiorrhiza TaxID=226208 RepID=UPI0025ACDFA5|nr:GDSL esterase/lipase LIP-4-like isoform X1 [Salvia miltiorrhiza]